MTDPMRKAFDHYKSAYKGEVLFFQLGKFYEVYYEDADLIERIQKALAEKAVGE